MYTATHLIVDWKFEPVLQEHTTKDKRTVQFLGKIKSIFNEKKIDVSIFGNMNQKICPFTGGGPVSQINEVLSSLCDVWRLQTRPFTYPRPEGQLRCGNIEDTVNTANWRRNRCTASSQHALCGIWSNSKNKDRSNGRCEKFRGMVLCFPPLPIHLLCLTIDFQSNNVSYQRLFRSSSSFHLSFRRHLSRVSFEPIVLIVLFPLNW